jgi:hypothetical protein
MDFTAFIGWAFEALLAGIAAYGVHVLAKLLQNIADLNTQMAVVLTRIGFYEDRIRRLEEDKE